MRGSVDELSFTCPHCGARVGEFCVRNGVKRKDWPHSARVAKIPPSLARMMSVPSEPSRLTLNPTAGGIDVINISEAP